MIIRMQVCFNVDFGQNLVNMQALNGKIPIIIGISLLKTAPPTVSSVYDIAEQ